MVRRLGLAVLVFILPMMMGLWVAKLAYKEDLLRRSESVATLSLHFLEQLVSFAEDANFNALPLINGSCDQALPTLRQLASFQPFLRSVDLVKESAIVCSSLLGPTPPRSANPLGNSWMWLEQGRWMRPGVPHLIVYAERGRDGVRAVIDANAIDFMMQFTDPLVDTYFHVGDNWLDTNGSLSNKPPVPSELPYYEANSQQYPVSVYAKANDLAPWWKVWQTRQQILIVLLGVSLLLAGGVFWFMGKPRSLYGELMRGIRHREFVPYLQPVVFGAEGKLDGCEVLIRWQHAQLGIIPPDRFIPMAEASGLIVPMTRSLMDQVLATLLPYQYCLPEKFAFGFNISACHFRDLSLVEDCRRFFDAFREKRIVLVLELTERELLVADEMTDRVFAELRELGVKIAIDDFGTGNSSLTYLQQFKVDLLKIDRSFVSLIGTDALSRHIVDNVIDLATRLDLKIVAEGVETKAQADHLYERNVHLQQGYYHGHPVPMAAFINQWLQPEAPVVIAAQQSKSIHNSTLEGILYE